MELRLHVRLDDLPQGTIFPWPRQIEKYDISLDPQYDDMLQMWPKKPWQKFVTSENQRFISTEAIDLLDRLLRYDHQERLTAKEAQGHPYFEPVRNAAASNGGHEPAA